MRTPTWRSRCLSAAIATSLLALGGPLTTARAAGGPDIALGDTASSSSAHSEYGASRITDGNQGTYWQSAGPDLPQWVQADLGTATRVDEVVLKLPAHWESRNQTLSVQGSTDGTSFTTLKSSAGYAFTPGEGNTVTVSFPATQTRFVRVEHHRRHRLAGGPALRARGALGARVLRRHRRRPSPDGRQPHRGVRGRQRR